VSRQTLSHQLWAEFVGTAILVVFGDGVVANVLYATRLGPGGYNWDTIALGWAFAVVMAIYVAGGITGAHINPAVTLAAITRRTISVGTGLLYIVVQIVGAFVGAFIVWLVYQGSFATDGFRNVFYTAPSAGYENMVFTQYFTEIVCTFFLLVFIYAIVDNLRNVGPGANLWPFMIGMAVLAIGLSLGGPTGYAINPARDLGPRLFAALVANDTAAFSGAYFLVPILGPLLGGVAGAWFYDFLVRPFLPARRELLPEPRGADLAPAPATPRRAA
jgi:glycerol uptake facilitator protein